MSIEAFGQTLADNMRARERRRHALVFLALALLAFAIGCGVSWVVVSMVRP